MKNLLTIAIAMLFIASCVKVDNNEITPSEPNDGLVVPADFTWNTVKNASVTVNTDDKADFIIIYNGDPEKGGKRIMTLDYKPGLTIPSIPVPTYLDNLYVRILDSLGNIINQEVIAGSSSSQGAGAPMVKSGSDAPISSNVISLTPSSTMTIPSENSWGTYCFEDLWPSQGDYDMNDMLIGFNYQATTVEGEYSVLTLKFILKAYGSYPTNSSASIRLINIRPSDALYMYKYIGDNFEGFISSTSGQEFIDIPLFDRAGDVVIPVNNSDKNFYNTKIGGARANPKIIEVNIVLDPSIDAVSYLSNLDNLDLYMMYEGKRSNEIHMKNTPPTKLGLESTPNYLGKYKDHSNLAAKRYYVTKENYVWVMRFLHDIDYPKEGVNILDAFPGYRGWVTSSGVSQRDWYMNPIMDKIYSYTPIFKYPTTLTENFNDYNSKGELVNWIGKSISGFNRNSADWSDWGAGLPLLSIKSFFGNKKLAMNRGTKRGVGAATPILSMDAQTSINFDYYVWDYGRSNSYAVARLMDENGNFVGDGVNLGVLSGFTLDASLDLQDFNVQEGNYRLAIMCGNESNIEFRLDNINIYR